MKRRRFNTKVGTSRGLGAYRNKGRVGVKLNNSEKNIVKGILYSLYYGIL